MRTRPDTPESEAITPVSVDEGIDLLKDIPMPDAAVQHDDKAFATLLDGLPAVPSTPVGLPLHDPEKEAQAALDALHKIDFPTPPGMKDVTAEDKRHARQLLDREMQLADAIREADRKAYPSLSEEKREEIRERVSARRLLEVSALREASKQMDAKIAQLRERPAPAQPPPPSPHFYGQSKVFEGIALPSQKPQKLERAPMRPRSKEEADLPAKKQPEFWQQFKAQLGALRKAMAHVGRKLPFLKAGMARLKTFVRVIWHGGVKDAAAAATKGEKAALQGLETKKSNRLKKQDSAQTQLHKAEARLTQVLNQIKEIRIEIKKLSSDSARLPALEERLQSLKEQVTPLREAVKACQEKLQEATAQVRESADAITERRVIGGALEVARRSLEESERQHNPTCLGAAVSPAGGLSGAAAAAARAEKGKDHAVSPKLGA